MDKGELLIFCKDFAISLPKSKIQDSYARVSRD